MGLGAAGAESWIQTLSGSSQGHRIVKLGGVRSSHCAGVDVGVLFYFSCSVSPDTWPGVPGFTCKKDSAQIQ